MKLLDFGISKLVDYESLTRTGQLLGTPRYMAPEQLSADKDIDARVDIYALGVILYEALAGQPPFFGATPDVILPAILSGPVTPLRTYAPDLPDGVDVVVARAMARAKEARFDSALELCEAWVHAAEPRATFHPESVTVTRAFGATDAALPIATPQAAGGAPASFSDFDDQGQGRAGVLPPTRPLPKAELMEPEAPILPSAAYDGAGGGSARRERGWSLGKVAALLFVALIVGGGTAAALIAGLTGDTPDANPPAEPGATPPPSAPGIPVHLQAPEARYREALDAQARGDFARCVESVRAALADGGSALYSRTAGECYDAQGDATNARKSYEHYCAAATPADPSWARVQARVAVLGGRCGE